MFSCIIVLSIATIPSVLSQTATTVTSILTTTGAFTWTSFSSTVVGTATIISNQTSAIISSTTNTVAVMGPNYCTWSYWTISVLPGTSEVTGTIGPSSFRIGFYIMNPQQFGNLRTEVSASCSGPFTSEVAVESITSTYSLDWQNPAAGSYYVVFFNSGGSSFPITTPFFLVATSTQEQTSTIYSATGAEVTGPTTQTITSLQTSQLTASSPFTSIPGFPWESLFVGFLVGLAILILRPRKNSTP